MFSGNLWVTWNKMKLDIHKMICPITINGRFLPNLPLVLSTMNPIKGSVTPSHRRIIMEKLDASTTAIPTKPVR